MTGVETHDLYGLPLEQFVPERTALSRELRSAGRREEAAEVAQLRKPSVAAWAVNQLVRTQGQAVRELFGAGDELREANQRVLSGAGDAAALRAAADRERAAVDALMDAARGLLSSEGHELSPATIDRVGDTLHAAALEDHAREEVRGGRLERELRHVGLGELAPGGVVSKPSPAKGRKPASAGGREREAARKAEAAAKREAARAVRAVRVAEERRERAARALRDSDEALAAAVAEAEQAEEEHREARERLENL